jgi:SPP1 gp7 family putative phage head morphogenesis protein
MGLRDSIDAARRVILSSEEIAAGEMTTAYGEALSNIGADLQIVLNQIQQLRALGQPVTNTLLTKKTRFESLLKQVDTQIDGYSKLADRVITAQQRDAVKAARKTSLELIQAGQGPYAGEAKLPAPFLRFDPKTVETLVGRLGDGSPLRSLLTQLAPQAVEIVKQTLIESVIRGENPRTIAPLLSQRMGIPLSRSLTISRTETIGAFREASIVGYRQNPKVVKGWIWTCAKNARTCPMCLAMDGQEFDLDVPFGSHPNCRCTPRPNVRSFKEQGIKAPDRRPTLQTGEEWLASQNPDVQRQVLGHHYEMYREGHLRLKDLVGYKEDEQWGPSRWVRSRKQIQEGRFRPTAKSLGEIPISHEVFAPITDKSSSLPELVDVIKTKTPKGQERVIQTLRDMGYSSSDVAKRMSLEPKFVDEVTARKRIHPPLSDAEFNRYVKPNVLPKETGKLSDQPANWSDQHQQIARRLPSVPERHIGYVSEWDIKKDRLRPGVDFLPGRIVVRANDNDLFTLHELGHIVVDKEMPWDFETGKSPLFEEWSKIAIRDFGAKRGEPSSSGKNLEETFTNVYASVHAKLSGIPLTSGPVVKEGSDAWNFVVKLGTNPPKVSSSLIPLPEKIPFKTAKGKERIIQTLSDAGHTPESIGKAMGLSADQVKVYTTLKRVHPPLSSEELSHLGIQLPEQTTGSFIDKVTKWANDGSLSVQSVAELTRKELLDPSLNSKRTWEYGFIQGSKKNLEPTKFGNQTIEYEPAFRRNLQEAAEVIEQTFGPAARKALDHLDILVTPPGSRASARAESFTLCLPADCPVRTAVHEIGHILSYEFPEEIGKPIQEFFKRRTAGEEARSLSGFPESEKFKIDKFFHGYVGSSRGDEAPHRLEVMSMGAENLLFDTRRMVLKDPEHAELIHSLSQRMRALPADTPSRSVANGDIEEITKLKKQLQEKGLIP